MRGSARRVAKQTKPRGPAPATSHVSSTTGVGGKGCADSLEGQVFEEIVAATYWFDSGERGEPYTALIRFSGRRIGPTGKPQARDRFDQVEVVPGVIPGSGPISITTRVHGINPGEWVVNAQPIVQNGRGRFVKQYAGPVEHGARGSERAPWSWRKRMDPRSSTTPVKTGWAPFAKLPGSTLAAWWGFVGPGVLLGLAVQAVLVARAHLDIRAALIVSLAASLAGFIGSKVWFLALDRSLRGLRGEGLCIQGFVAGAVITAAVALPLAHIPVGTYLDATAPGLFLGMALGRPGCFFTGCCAGRPTASRWGIWSSDRRVGARRIPIQLMESILCLAIASLALLLVLRGVAGPSGAVFVGAVAAYALGRQFLLPFRAIPRKSSIGPRLTMSAAALVLTTVIVVLTVGCMTIKVHLNLLLC